MANLKKTIVGASALVVAAIGGAAQAESVNGLMVSHDQYVQMQAHAKKLQLSVDTDAAGRKAMNELVARSTGKPEIIVVGTPIRCLATLPNGKCRTKKDLKL